MKPNKQQRLILISEAMLQNVIDLTANFIELMNGVFADRVVAGKNEQTISDEDFKKPAIDRIKISDEWIKNFIEQNKPGRVCNDYGVALRGNDFFKNYSKLSQSAYKTKGNNNFSGYRGNSFDKPLYDYKLYKGLQNIRRLEENLLRLPKVFRSYAGCRGIDNNGYRALGKFKHLYFNVQNDKGEGLYKSLDTYFNN